MCGIYGTTRNITREEVDRKLSLIDFRGPDYFASDVSKNVILGHRRLSIIDLDSRSNQPLKYGSLRITFNGEIYNYRSLRNQLISDGYHFETNGDTEVICALYLKYEERLVDKLIGMFAFVIHDEKKGILFGARDRTGQKPFYYSLADESFEFSSQPSQIALGRNMRVNYEALNAYLLLKYIPTGFSAWEEIRSLEPGWFFKYTIGSKNFVKYRYWDPFSVPVSFAGDYEDALSEFEYIFSESVKMRMESDVPLGVFLSGGVDSSLVAAYAAENSVEKINTFSIKFGESDFDESHYAKAVGNALGTNHYTFECSPNEGMHLIEDYLKYYDEPFSDSSAIPSMLLSRETKKKVTVALTGDGADESFMGYKRYDYLNLIGYMMRFPSPLKAVLHGSSEVLPFTRLKTLGRLLKTEDIYKVYENMMTTENEFLKSKPSIGFANTLRDLNGGMLDRISRFEIHNYMTNDINTKVDRASMAYSMEARSPFLDHRLIEFALSLPQNYKFKRGYQKRILKDALNKHLPSHIINRPKAGFSMPFELWFRNELKEFVMDELNDKFLDNFDILIPEICKHKIQNHMEGKENNFPLIWSLLVVKKWISKYDV